MPSCLLCGSEIIIEELRNTHTIWDLNASKKWREAPRLALWRCSSEKCAASQTEKLENNFDERLTKKDIAPEFHITLERLERLEKLTLTQPNPINDLVYALCWEIRRCWNKLKEKASDVEGKA